MVQSGHSTLIYYVWLTSDWAYFGGERLEAMAQRHGVTIDYRPVNLLEVYARTGGLKLKDRSQQRKDYRLAELKRWRDRLKMPLNIEAKFRGADEELGSCMIIAAKRRKLQVGGLVNGFLRAVWAEERDIADHATAVEIATRLGFDGRTLAEEAKRPDIREEFVGTVELAVKDGCFGSPFYIYQGEPFWGQDRLDFLEEAIVRGKKQAA